jgi:hypothetical protein
MSLKAKIGSLPENPVAAAVYRRANGDTYARLNERFHVKCKITDENEVLGDGVAEEIDLEEVVEVIHRNGEDETSQYESQSSY